MNRIKDALKRKKRTYDSDSIGYISTNSDHSFTRSQFILRPHSAYSSLASSSYTPFDYEHLPCTSYSSSILSKEGSIYDSQYVMCSTLDEFSISSDSNQNSTYMFTKDSDSEESIYATSTIDMSTTISDDYDLEDLFEDLIIDSSHYHPSTSTENNTLKRKRLLIKEPDDSSKIYFSEQMSGRKNVLPFSGSIPRSILKKKPSLTHSHIYEEIENDYLSPEPEDVRPVPPERPAVLPFRIFPPCKTFQPRRLQPRSASTRKRANPVPEVKRASSFSFGFFTLSIRKN